MFFAYRNRAVRFDSHDLIALALRRFDDPTNLGLRACEALRHREIKSTDTGLENGELADAKFDPPRFSILTSADSAARLQVRAGLAAA